MIREFAEQHKLRIRLDGCRDPIISGRFGHFYEHSSSQMGLCIENPAIKPFGIRKMRSKMRQIEALGLQKRQEGDSEGTFLLKSGLEAEKPLVARLCKITGIRKIRKATGRPFEKRIHDGLLLNERF